MKFKCVKIEQTDDRRYVRILKGEYAGKYLTYKIYRELVMGVKINSGDYLIRYNDHRLDNMAIEVEKVLLKEYDRDR